MLARRIIDWDDAYANMPHIAGGAEYPERWARLAETFRGRMEAAGRARLGLAYGGGERNRYDLFLPEDEARGLFVFIHGGYWMRFERTHWSHLAAGPLFHGYAVAMPSYTLCPDIRIAGITAEIGRAVEAVAAEIAGPIVLSGHSAGGHLATRMVCADTPLESGTLARVRHVLSLSGVHDLRPLLNIATNETLKLDAAEAEAESPALKRPAPGIPVTCWAGQAERAEFLRQNALLANIWTGLGVETRCVEEPDRHHFDVVDGLADPGHPMTRLVCGSA